MLLFGAVTWVLTPRVERAPDSFHHRFARWITGRKLWIQGNRIWDYPPLVEAMGEAGFKEIRNLVTRT